MEFLKNLTIGKKITLLTGVGLLLGVGVFSALGMRAVNQATDSMLQDRLTTARLVADYADESLGRALVELASSADSVSENASAQVFAAEIRALEVAFSRSLIDTYGVYILDRNGDLLWKAENAPDLDGISLSSYTSVKQTMVTGTPTVSGLVSAPVSNVPVILLSAGGSSGAGGPIVVSAIDVTQSGISGFLRPVRLGKTGYAEIVDQNGVVVTRTDPGPRLSPFEESDHSVRFASLIAAGRPARGVCHTCHEAEQKIARQDVLAFVPMATADWGVVIRQSEKEALAPASRLRLSLVLSGAGLVTVALIFVIVTTRDVGTRIGTLTSASRRIAEGDLTSPVARLGYDEVGTLAATLDEMRVKLRSTYGDLEQKTRELSSLLSVSEIMTSSAELPGLLASVLAKAVEVVPGAHGGVLLIKPENDERVSVYVATKPDSPAAVPENPLPGASPGDRMPRGGEERESGDSDWRRLADDYLEGAGWNTPVRSNLLAEVAGRNGRIGCIVMANMSDRGAFSESDLRLLQGIADYVAIAIEKSSLTRQAEEARAIYEADRLRSELISSVSHELRSPLTLIKGYSTSLLRHDVKWEAGETREFLKVIDEKTDVLRDLIDKLLQSARLEAGALRLEKEPLLIPQRVRKISREPDLNSKKHCFTLEFDPSFPVIEADFRCMEQVLRNLLQNAVKYSGEGTEIIISGEAHETTVQVHVRDAGIGISEEDRDRIFERFFRVDSPAVRSTAGSGLGLSIAKAHVEAHGGRLWLESEAGSGSCFSFSLPLETLRSDE